MIDMSAVFRKMLKAGEVTYEDELLQEEQNTQGICEIIPKVN